MSHCRVQQPAVAPTLVLDVEVGMGVVVILQPAVGDEARVRIAHELLAKHIHAMVDVLQPLVAVLPCEFGFFRVILGVVSLPQIAKAMHVVEAFKRCKATVA